MENICYVWLDLKLIGVEREEFIIPHTHSSYTFIFNSIIAQKEVIRC